MGGGDAVGGKDEQIGQFLREDYGLKVEFLKAHFERMWKRFEFFLAIESALFGFYFKFLLTEEGGGLRSDAGLFAWLGFASALVGVLFGAQDRWLVTTYRRNLERAGRSLAEHLAGRLDVQTWAGEYVPVASTKDLPAMLGPEGELISARNPLEWHTRFASTTMLPGWFALGVLALWVITLVRYT